MAYPLRIRWLGPSLDQRRCDHPLLYLRLYYWFVGPSVTNLRPLIGFCASDPQSRAGIREKLAFWWHHCGWEGSAQPELVGSSVVVALAAVAAGICSAWAAW